MGPNIQSVERTSQATPFAADFLKLLQGQLSTAQGVPTGTAGSTPGQSAQQYTNFQQRLGGINTAGNFADETPALIAALTARSNATTDRNAAALREGHGALGNRFGSSLTRGEGLLRSEAGLNLDQLIAGVMLDRSNALQQARQFDTMANIESVAPFFNMAGLGIIPNEIIASPGVGQQLLSAGIDGLAAYLSGGGSFGFGGGKGGAPNMGGGGSMPQLPRIDFGPNTWGNRRPQAPGQGALPNFGGDPFYNPQFGPRF